MSAYRKAKKRVELSVGESVRIIRELQELSQNDLAAATGIPQSTISAIERDRVKLGLERTKILARALRVHPAVLVFPGWDRYQSSAAQYGCPFLHQKYKIRPSRVHSSFCTHPSADLFRPGRLRGSFSWRCFLCGLL